MNKYSSLNINGQLLSLEKPIVMGILNLTPDSFFEGSRAMYEKEIIERTTTILTEGAKIVDIGAYSSRPGAIDISSEEEWERLKNGLSIIRREFPEIPISIDTFRASIARRAVEEFSVGIINDISGGDLDPDMHTTIAELKIPYIIMHMRGTPQTMNNDCNYENMIQEILMNLAQKVNSLHRMGVCDLIIDPGFGFSKTIEQNFELLRRLDEFNIFELPLLAGLSRKSMIFKTLGTTPSEALNGTTVLNTVALQKGANILRVHDVLEAVECVELISKLNE